MTYKDKGSYEFSPPSKVSSLLILIYTSTNRADARETFSCGICSHRRILAISPEMYIRMFCIRVWECSSVRTLFALSKATRVRPGEKFSEVSSIEVVYCPFSARSLLRKFLQSAEAKRMRARRKLVPPLASSTRHRRHSGVCYVLGSLYGALLQKRAFFNWALLRTKEIHNHGRH